MKIGLRFLLAAICTACMTSTAIASNIVLGYNDNSLSCGFQAAACQGLPGVVGSNLVGAGALPLRVSSRDFRLVPAAP